MHRNLNGHSQTPFDIVFIVDESGSMDDEQAALQANVPSLFTELQTLAPGSRAGLVGFGGFVSTPSENPRLLTALTDDSVVFGNAAAGLTADGSDEPGYQATYTTVMDVVVDTTAFTMGFTKERDFCVVLFTDTRSNGDAGITQQDVIDALNNDVPGQPNEANAQGTFFGVTTGTSAFNSYEPIADATGGAMESLGTFVSDTQTTLDAILAGCSAAVNPDICIPPNDDYSEMVDLSYYPEDTPIEVTFDENGFPKQFFKFVGCSSGKTKFKFWTCAGGQQSGADSTLGFWKRDKFDYFPRPFTKEADGIEYCFNDNDCSGCGLCEKAVDFVCNYDEEVYLNPGELSGNNLPFTFKYKTYGDFPCAETATATYVHGSTDVDMNPGQEYISTQFLFSGSMQNPEFDVVIFNDQTCSLPTPSGGAVLGGTVPENVGQGKPPITFTYPDPPFQIAILDPANLNQEHDPHTVVLTLNKENLDKHTGLWVESGGTGQDPYIAVLRYCMQFRVDKKDDEGFDHLVEFVDVAFKITVNLEADCTCDNPAARQIEAAAPGSEPKCVCPCPAADPYCGPVIILRDDIFEEDVYEDPLITMKCGPCEGEHASVTQGDTLPVCVTIDGDWCFADKGLTELELTVSDPDNVLTSTSYHIYPDAPETLVSSPPACKGNRKYAHLTADRCAAVFLVHYDRHSMYFIVGLRPSLPAPQNASCK